MQVRILLGPAGAGKTRRCIREAQACLEAAAEGPDLLFIAPKQATFQIERQVLADGLKGFTRLHILSFERLARHIFDRFGLAPPPLLSEPGRVMALEAILRNAKADLSRLKSAGAHRLAREVSEQLREFQKQGISPARLKQIAGSLGANSRLGLKLTDLARIFEEYLRWLAANKLKDFEGLLDAAAELLENADRSLFATIWLDGFAQMTPQELRLLGAVSRGADRVTLAFCCESESEPAWFSHWAGITQLVRRCRGLFAEVSNAAISSERLERGDSGRFAAAPDLRHLEANWHAGAAYSGEARNLSMRACSSTEMEAVCAAREILKFVRGGGRFKETAVLMRSLEAHHEIIRRVFERYKIPLFLDRRESVSHHPLIELTRSALRVVCDDWQHDDWFAYLKSGLVPIPADDVHWLENEARAVGWTGEMWRKHLPSLESDSKRIEGLRRRLARPMAALTTALAGNMTGPQLADALESFWEELGVCARLEKWQTEQPGGPEIHHAVWTQVGQWINDVRLAFPTQALPLNEWIPLLENGLSDLTVGVVPPALDQTLVGAVDRSRNPDLKLVICVGLNEGVFPATPIAIGLFSESEREQLGQQGCALGGRLRENLAQEEFYGYAACTRARERLVVTFAETDSKGKALHPSIFAQKLRRLFPNLQPVTFSHQDVEKEWQHLCELIPQLLPNPQSDRAEWSRDPACSKLMEELRWCRVQPIPSELPAELAERLYSRELHTSVSKFEDFPACPFKFLVHSGLRAKERKSFELDSRQQGLFQHKLLELFHRGLCQEKKCWRDIEANEARRRIQRLADEITPGFGEGILIAKPENKFLAQIYTNLIADFIVQIIAWMREQWLFNPAEVEIGFGKEDELGRWPITLASGKSLVFHGRIDRIDLWKDPATGSTRYVVIDYKSGGKKLNKALFERGLQQQLAAYLLAIKGSEKARELLGATKLEPAGAFFVSLRPELGTAKNRDEALDERQDEKSESYKHAGLFDFSMINQLDATGQRDQIAYRVRKDAKELHAKSSFGPKYAPDFAESLEQIERQLREMAERVFSGEIAVHPYKLGSQVACARCDFIGICRFDAWRDSYNVIS